MSFPCHSNIFGVQIDFAWLILLVQLFLGTQLREVFDVFYAKLHLSREHWIEQSGMKFLVHRSFSIVYFISILYISYFFYKNQNSIAEKFKYIYLIPGICLFEILSGVIMAYFNVPKFLQPIHVFTSAALLLAHTHLLVNNLSSSKN